MFKKEVISDENLYVRYLNKKTKFKKSLEKLPFSKLQEFYAKLSKTLNRKYLGASYYRTVFETKYFQEISRCTKLEPLRNIWIANRNIDLFFYQVRSPNNAGMAFEIDGPIHNVEPKMRKDNLKEILLAEVGIYVVRFNNYDRRQYLIKRIIQEIKFLKRLDTRGRKRLLKKIFVLTILYNSTTKDILNLLRSANN